MPTYLVLDSETTGLASPVKPVELAWIHINENLDVLDEQVHRINPYLPISEGASAIHGIFDVDIALCPTVEEVVVNLPQPFVAIGHNISYDLRVLSPYVEYNGDLCTLALSRRWVKNMTNHKLSTLKAELKLSEQTSHSALGDCRTVLELLHIITRLSGRSLSQLTELEATPKMLSVMPFGMHRGKRFDQVPRSYREWLRSKEDLHKDLKYTLDNLRIV